MWLLIGIKGILSSSACFVLNMECDLSHVLWKTELNFCFVYCNVLVCACNFLLLDLSILFLFHADSVEVNLNLSSFCDT